MKPPHIDHYNFGQITIDGQTYNKDLIIFPEHILTNWWRISGHNLAVEDLNTVFQDPPKKLIIGQGASGLMKVSRETRQALNEAGIETLILTTAEACQRYNEQRNEIRVVAALHLTC